MSKLTPLEVAEALESVSNMINMGEKIAWGHETALLDQAAQIIREQHEALASITHQLRGWQPEEVAVDSDLMEDASAIERALRVLGGQSNS